MTAIQGYKCDVCGTFGTERRGWMKLEIHGVAAQGESGFQDICSNKCLATLAMERAKDIEGIDLTAGEPPKRKRYSAETKARVTMRAQEVGWPEAAREFDVPYTSTFRWQKEAKG